MAVRGYWVEVSIKLVVARANCTDTHARAKGPRYLCWCHCKNELTLTVLLRSDAFKVVGRNQRVGSLTVSSITRQPAPPEGQILTRGPGPAVLVRVLDDVLRGLIHGAPLSWSINGQKENYELH